MAHPEIQRQFGLRLPTGLLIAMGTAAASLVALGLSARRGAAGELVSGLLRWKVDAGWYLIALAGPASLMVGATAIHVALGGAWPDYPEPARWPLFAVNFLAVLILGGPLGEELGWRGYSLPRMIPIIGFASAGALLGRCCQSNGNSSLGVAAMAW